MIVFVIVVVVVLKIGLNGRKLKRTKFAERSDPDVVRIETRTRLVHSPHVDSFFCLYHYDLSRLRALFFRSITKIDTLPGLASIQFP